MILKWTPKVKRKNIIIIILDTTNEICNNTTISYPTRQRPERIGLGNGGLTRTKKGKMMDLNELTIGQARELASIFNTGKTDASGPWEIGKKYFIRTVTMHLTGELVSVSAQELVLKDAAWIADSGRFNEALKDISKCKEVEPFVNPVIVGRGSIVDASTISNIITSVK